jgi:thiol-disulfide isomerase/thioredoxin
MKKYFLANIILLALSVNCFSQTVEKNIKFFLKGELLTKDTGHVVLWYYDFKNKFHADTAILNKGKFIFTGTVNLVCEALLWTNLQNLDFDDHSVIRFLLEPNKIYISYSDSKIVIKGSTSQIEKENWDREKLDLLTTKATIRKNADSLYQLSKIDKLPVNGNNQQIVSINETIKVKDLGYIRSHKDSYLSGYLLSKHNRRLVIDSLQIYYSLLDDNVKRSTIGYKLLEIIYPLTNDQNFRKLNPLYDIKFDERLNKIKSIYDFTLSDTAANKIEFLSFKGKYLVLDFWASWCVPCLANIPTQKEMINDYKADSIEFISISLDTDIDKWKQSIKKYHLDGLQLSAPEAFAELIAVYYKVLWVPHYIIIDKNGLVVNPNAPQPLDPKLKIILDSLLRK